MGWWNRADINPLKAESWAFSPEVKALNSGMKSGMKGALWKVGKPALIVGGVVAGVTALGLVAGRSRKSHSFDPAKDLPDDGLDRLPPVLPPQQMVYGPAEGRRPNEWQERVRPGAAAQQQAIPGNPNMNVLPSESVEDLGTPVPQR